MLSKIPIQTRLLVDQKTSVKMALKRSPCQFSFLENKIKAPAANEHAKTKEIVQKNIWP